MRREQVSDGGVAKPLATNTKAVRELLTFQTYKTDKLKPKQKKTQMDRGVAGPQT